MNLKRYLFSLIAILTVCTCMKAQSISVQKFEGDISLGFTYPLDEYDTQGLMGLSASCEMRYNVPSSPFDVGIHIGYTTIDFDDKIDHCLSQSDATLNFAAVGDWNPRQGQNVSPYFGMGVGVRSNTSEIKPLLMPRIGVELWRNFRITASASISQKYWNCFAIQIGLVLGGRRH